MYVEPSKQWGWMVVSPMYDPPLLWNGALYLPSLPCVLCTYIRSTGALFFRGALLFLFFVLFSHEAGPSFAAGEERAPWMGNRHHP